jgi:hypothetical protein
MQCIEEQKINNQIEAFIKANPYPTFEEMEDLQFRRLDLDSEYGETNHNYCKNIYETMHLPNNKKILDKWIECIKSGGGSQALKCNLETILLFSPLAKCIEQEVLQKFNEIYNYVVAKL